MHNRDHDGAPRIFICFSGSKLCITNFPVPDLGGGDNGVLQSVALPLAEQHLAQAK